MAFLSVAGTVTADPGDDRYDNTFMKDFIMDAPWRVTDLATAIPLTIILKDCDADDIRELHWIRCWDVTSSEIMLWNHDFGDETIGDDAYANYWTYITTVTEGHTEAPLSISLARNPFRGEASFDLVLPSAGPAVLSIYDTSGHLVKSLSTGWAPAGRGV